MNIIFTYVTGELSREMIKYKSRHYEIFVYSSSYISWIQLVIHIESIKSMYFKLGVLNTSDEVFWDDVQKWCTSLKITKGMPHISKNFPFYILTVPCFWTLINTFVYMNSVYVWSMSMSMSNVNCAVPFTLFFVSIFVPNYVYVLSVIKYLFNFNSFFLSFVLFIYNCVNVYFVCVVLSLFFLFLFLSYLCVCLCEFCVYM